MDEDADATFARWARNNVEAAADDDDDDRRRRTGSSSSPPRSRGLQDSTGEGTHFLEAYVGSPAQKRILAISSAADFTAFPCEVRAKGERRRECVPFFSFR
jgi:hypothetical protein